MTNKTEDKFYFGNIGTKAESELTVRITKMLGEVERAVLSRNQEKAKSIASKVREMIRKSANTSTAKMQMDELNSIMLGVSFSRKGKSERFGMAEQVMRDGSVHLDFSAARDYLAKQSDEGLRYIIKDAKSARDAMGTAGRKFHYYTDLVLEAQQELKKRGFSRPGQPERFGLEDACWEGYEPVGTKQKDGRTVPNCVPKDTNEQPEEFAHPENIAWMRSLPASVIARVREILSKPHSSARAKALRDTLKSGGVSYNKWIPDASAGAEVLGHQFRDAFARLGSPDKFDASSLDRGNFAEASKSPMLGKLLAAKVMPDGGWRAVQVGSDTLVISFEDADLARDFGRRASTKGYSATSPVATTGRYWNVEVKNGK